MPELFLLDGNWELTLQKLYKLFEQDFIVKERWYKGYQVTWDTRKVDGIYDEGFWHLISKMDKFTGERIPDFRRAERLPWCGPTIDNESDVEVKVWDYREKNKKIRTYLWLESWDYVIVLEKRRNKSFVILITAYYVEGPSTVRNLNQKYADRIL